MTNHTSAITDPTTAATAKLVEAFVQSCMCSTPTRPTTDFTSDPKTLAMHAGVRAAFPDADFELAWCVVEGNRAALGGHMRGTHLGEWRAVRATGRRIDVLATITFVCEDGRILDMSSVNDSFELAVQLGIVDQLGPKACQLDARPGAESHT
jgi:predicted ester cyclase